MSDTGGSTGGGPGSRSDQSTTPPPPPQSKPKKKSTSKRSRGSKEQPRKSNKNRPIVVSDHESESEDDESRVEDSQRSPKTKESATKKSSTKRKRLAGDESESDEDEDDVSGPSTERIKEYLTKNIKEVAKARVVKKGKREYVTKTNKEWTAELQPLFKEFEKTWRRATLATLGKHLVDNIVSMYFKQFEGAESAWIHKLARLRARDNTNSWKSRTMARLFDHVIDLEEQEQLRFAPMCSVESTQMFLTGNFKPDEFEVLFCFCSDWIDVAGSTPLVKAWCLTIYVELCTSIKRHLQWERLVALQKPSGKQPLTWQWVLNRWDTIYDCKAYESFQIGELAEIKERPRSKAHNKKKKKKIEFSNVDNDAAAFKPTASTFSAVGINLPTPPSGTEGGDGNEDGYTGA